MYYTFLSFCQIEYQMIFMQNAQLCKHACNIAESATLICLLHPRQMVYIEESGRLSFPFAISATAVHAYIIEVS